jgi:hypothetical protein
MIVDLASTDKNFKDISTEMKKTVSAAIIHKIQRIQNRPLWTLFNMELKYMEDKHKR